MRLDPLFDRYQNIAYRQVFGGLAPKAPPRYTKKTA
jgi:hypothetical protein